MKVVVYLLAWTGEYGMHQVEAFGTSEERREFVDSDPVFKDRTYTLSIRWVTVR